MFIDRKDQILVTILILLVAVWVAWLLHYGPEVRTVRHYECWQGGELIYDKDVGITHIGRIVDLETGDRLKFKDMQCLTTEGRWK